MGYPSESELMEWYWWAMIAGASFGAAIGVFLGAMIASDHPKKPYRVFAGVVLVFTILGVIIAAGGVATKMAGEGCC